MANSQEIWARRFREEPTNNSDGPSGEFAGANSKGISFKNLKAVAESPVPENDPIRKAAEQVLRERGVHYTHPDRRAREELQVAELFEEPYSSSSANLRMPAQKPKPSDPLVDEHDPLVDDREFSSVNDRDPLVDEREFSSIPKFTSIRDEERRTIDPDQYKELAFGERDDTLDVEEEEQERLINEFKNTFIYPKSDEEDIGLEYEEPQSRRVPPLSKILNFNLREAIDPSNYGIGVILDSAGEISDSAEEIKKALTKKPSLKRQQLVKNWRNTFNRKLRNDAEKRAVVHAEVTEDLNEQLNIQTIEEKRELAHLDEWGISNDYIVSYTRFTPLEGKDIPGYDLLMYSLGAEEDSLAHKIVDGIASIANGARHHLKNNISGAIGTGLKQHWSDSINAGAMLSLGAFYGFDYIFNPKPIYNPVFDLGGYIGGLDKDRKTFLADVTEWLLIDEHIAQFKGFLSYWDNGKDAYNTWSNWRSHVELTAREKTYLGEISDFFEIPPDQRNDWQAALIFGTGLTPYGGWGLAARGAKLGFRNFNNIRLVSKVADEMGDAIDYTTKRKAIWAAATDFRINRLNEYGLPSAIHKVLMTDENIKKYSKKMGWTADQARKARRNDIIVMSASMGAGAGHLIGGTAVDLFNTYGLSDVSKEEKELVTLGFGIIGSFGAFNKLVDTVNPAKGLFPAMFAYIGQAEGTKAQKFRQGIWNVLKRSGRYGKVDVDPEKMRTSKFLRSYLEYNGFSKEQIVTMKNAAEDQGNHVINEARNLRKRARDAQKILTPAAAREATKLIEKADTLIESNIESGLLLKDTETDEISINKFHLMEKHVNVESKAVDFMAAFMDTINGLPKEQRDMIEGSIQASFDLLQKVTSLVPDLEDTVTISLAQALQSAPLAQLQLMLQNKIEVSARKGHFLRDSSLLAEANLLQKQLQGQSRFITRAIDKISRKKKRLEEQGKEDEASLYGEVSTILTELNAISTNSKTVTTKKLEALNELHSKMKYSVDYGDSAKLKALSSIIKLDGGDQEVLDLGERATETFESRLSSAEIKTKNLYTKFKADADANHVKIDISNIVPVDDENISYAIMAAKRSSVPIQDNTLLNILKSGVKKTFEENILRESNPEKQYNLLLGVLEQFSNSNKASEVLFNNREQFFESAKVFEKAKNFKQGSEHIISILAENGYLSLISMSEFIELRSKLWNEAMLGIRSDNGRIWFRKTGLINSLDDRLEDASQTFDPQLKSNFEKINKSYKEIMLPWKDKSGPIHTIFNTIKDNGHGVSPEQFYLSFVKFGNTKRSKEYFDQIFLDDKKNYPQEILKDLLVSIGYGIDRKTITQKDLFPFITHFRSVFKGSNYETSFEELAKYTQTFSQTAGLSKSIESALGKNVVGLIEELQKKYGDLFNDSLFGHILEMKGSKSSEDIWNLISNDFSNKFPFMRSEEIELMIKRERERASIKLRMGYIEENKNYKEVTDKIAEQFKELFPDDVFGDRNPSPIELITALARKNDLEAGTNSEETVIGSLKTLFAHKMQEQAFSFSKKVILETRDLATTLKQMPELEKFELADENNRELLTKFIVGIKTGDPDILSILKDNLVDPKKLISSEFNIQKDMDLVAMVEFYNQNKHHLKLLYTDQELKNLDQLFTFGMLTSPDQSSFDKLALIGGFTSMTTPMLLGRGYNVMKGVVGLRYVLGELSINKWREQRFLLMKEILTNKEYAKSFLDVFSNEGRYVQEKSFNYFIKKTIQLNALAQSRAEVSEIDRRANFEDEEIYTDYKDEEFYIRKPRLNIMYERYGKDTQRVNTRIFKQVRDEFLDYLTLKGRRVVKETDK